MVLAGSVVALEDVGDGGDLVEAQHSPRHVGQYEYHEDDHHYHRHSDISPVFGKYIDVLINRNVVTYVKKSFF